MDLSIPVNGTKLNIRVSVLIRTVNGYIFEKDKSGFYFPVGGRIQVNEDSVMAAKREIREELGLELNSLSYVATLENFFNYDNMPYHELNIIHQADIENFDCPEGFYIFKPDEIQGIDIKPVTIKDIIGGKMNQCHIIVRDK